MKRKLLKSTQKTAQSFNHQIYIYSIVHYVYAYVHKVGSVFYVSWTLEKLLHQKNGFDIIEIGLFKVATTVQATTSYNNILIVERRIICTEHTIFTLQFWLMAMIMQQIFWWSGFVFFPTIILNSYHIIVVQTHTHPPIKCVECSCHRAFVGFCYICSNLFFFLPVRRLLL